MTSACKNGGRNRVGYARLVKSDQNPLQPCWRGGSHKNDELIIEVSVGMWLVETICVDLLGAIDTIS